VIFRGRLSFPAEAFVISDTISCRPLPFCRSPVRQNQKNKNPGMIWSGLPPGIAAVDAQTEKTKGVN